MFFTNTEELNLIKYIFRIFGIVILNENKVKTAVYFDIAMSLQRKLKWNPEK